MGAKWIRKAESERRPAPGVGLVVGGAFGLKRVESGWTPSCAAHVGSSPEGDIPQNGFKLLIFLVQMGWVIRPIRKRGAEQCVTACWF